MDPDPFLSSIAASPVYGETVSTFSAYAIVLIVLAVVCLLLAAFVSASEAAFLSLYQTGMGQVAERRSPSDRRLNRLLADYGRVLVTLRVAGTLAKVMTVIFASSFFLESFHFDEPFVPLALFALGLFLLMQFVCETMPCVYSLRIPLSYCRRASWGMLALRAMLYPLTSLIIQMTDAVNKWTHAGRISMDDLSHALEISEKKDRPDESHMLEGIIRFGGEAVKEVMTPRLDIVDLDIRTPYKDVLKCVVENVYSRIPVYAGTKDDIKGILYIKDLLPHLNKGDNFRWQSLIRPAYFVPETKMIDDLLCDFQKNKIHIAIVVDEYGGTCGLMTMEDIIEEIVGEIRDEYDDEERTFTALDDHTWTFMGKTLLTDFCRVTGVSEHEFDEIVGDADTLAGLMLELKGEFPALHEVLKWHEYDFEILEMDNRRILKVKFTINPTDDNTATH